MNYNILTAQNSGNIADRITTFEANNRLFFVMADGAGDSRDAAEAADLVVELFQKEVVDQQFDAPDQLEAVLRRIDDAVFAESDSGETTAVIGQIVDGIIMGASCGDSCCWYYGIAFNHELTSLQYPKPLIGSTHATPIGFGPIMLETLLIGSDGFFNYAPQNQIIEQLTSKDIDINHLIKLATDQSGKYHDDCSLILITS